MYRVLGDCGGGGGLFHHIVVGANPAVTALASVTIKNWMFSSFTTDYVLKGHFCI